MLMWLGNLSTLSDRPLSKMIDCGLDGQGFTANIDINVTCTLTTTASIAVGPTEPFVTAWSWSYKQLEHEGGQCLVWESIPLHLLMSCLAGRPLNL
jgi:hypothetical protein